MNADTTAAGHISRHILGSCDAACNIHIQLQIETAALARTCCTGLAHDYGQLEKVPIPQLFMCLQVLNGGPKAPKWLLSLLMFLFVPIAKLVGFKPMYPEYRALSEAEAMAKGFPIEPVPT